MRVWTEGWNYSGRLMEEMHCEQSLEEQRKHECVRKEGRTFLVYVCVVPGEMGAGI